MQKKGQEGVMITVLLILIAISAVAAVSYFVMTQVRQGMAQATDKLDCLKLNYEIVSAVRGDTNITVRRISGGEDVNVTNIIVSIGKKINSTTNPGMMESKVVSGFDRINGGDKIEVTPVLKGGITCDVRASMMVSGSALELPSIYYPAGQKLYISPVDNSASIKWSPTKDNTGINSVTNGTNNTITLVKIYGLGSSFAAGNCSNLVYGGYDDWYLPARNQLSAIYVAHISGTINKGDYAAQWINYSNYYYWASTEITTNSAALSGFNDGSTTSDDKTYGFYLRCVRSD